MLSTSAQLGVGRRRVPVILQQERAECGMICLKMIAGYFGKKADPSRFRRQLVSSGHGTTFQELIAFAGQLQMIARPVRVSLPEVRMLKLPAVLHWSMNHFVVLVAVGRRRYVVHDPALGRRKVSAKEFGDSFTGVALEVARQKEFAQGGDRPEFKIGDFLVSFLNLYRYLAAIGFLLLVSQVLALVPSVATQIIVDEVVLGQDRVWLYRALGGLAIVMLTTTMLEGLRGWISLYSGTRLAVDSAVCVIDHLFRLPVSFVQRRHLGDLVSKLDSLGPIRRALTEDGVTAVVQAVVLSTTLLLMYLYSPWLTAVSVAGLTITTLMVVCLLPRERALSERALIHSASQNSSLIESLKAYETVSSLGIRETRRLHWQNSFLLANRAKIALGRLSILRAAASGTINAAEQVAFLAIGIAGVLDKEITLGVMFAFIVLRGRLGGAALALVNEVQRFSLLKVHTRRLADIVMETPIPDASAGAIAKPVVGDLCAKDLSFGYIESAPVFENFSCEITAGSAAVVTGSSGRGKTTLLKILAGQLSPGSGEVLVDGIERSLWNHDVLNSQCAMVLQNDRLFSGTIAQNITAFSMSPDLERVRESATIAGIWDDIQKLPMRWDTFIGDSANVLSGGQIQRLTLARALYRQPRILFLDEATSHLDTETERRVLQSIAELNITIVSIAHRPDTIALAEQVITLESR